MKLEDEIYQKEFRNACHKAMVNIIYTYGWLSTRLNAFLKPYALTLQQFNILRILRGQHPDPATINLLKARSLDKMSDVSRIVERLRQKGLVERKPASADRRAVAVRITREGLKLLQNIDRETKKLDQLLSNLSKKEAEQLNVLLDQIR